MDYNTNIKMVFSIFGSPFDPNYFSESINVIPTNSWMEGEFIPNNKKNKKREESAWEYSIHFDTIYFEEVSNKFVNIFEDKIDSINKFNNLTLKFDIVLEIVEEQGLSLYFNKPFLNIVNRLSAEIDVDTYILRNE
ncbi:DUF4279 domain-containing protein [Chryseobacterium antibioticum]|uniref:DUF4279 domain-containing protein n=1 Tax=Chryseobacterium pyrolae TaxID=2987481 RepID=A0ABT2ICU1_9FLAO|nr:DUF4279 domain-containing protein [Chryseobacterium pyrolae]MCT2406423.1 DUF4279 domain-containing protein [Chryseobacterium pyrolae]